MRTNVARTLLVLSALALSSCGKSGEINVRKPFPGAAPNLLQGIPPSLAIEQKLSAEFVESAEKPTPATTSSTTDL